MRIARSDAIPGEPAMPNYLMRSLLLGFLAFAASIGAAAQGTFRITSLFSNLDGSVQFIRLTETAGLQGQNHFAGLKLTSTHNGVTKEFTFPRDLPGDTAHRSIVVLATATWGDLMLVQLGSSSWGWYAGDFYMPSRFLATDGGSVDFAGIDQITYSSLPTDGLRGLLRDGTVADAALPEHDCLPFLLKPPGGCRLPTTMLQTSVTVVEYYNAALEHYFITASAPDLDALDSGRMPGWERTGFSFPVASSATAFPGVFPFVPGTMDAVCRYYLPPENGDSHFFSASTQECTDVRDRYPTFVLEDEAAFYAALPDLATGECPAPYFDWNDNKFTWLPVFRLWNARADTNHRYTVNLFVRNAMIAQGYVSEGYGPAGVAFCVLQQNIE